MCEEIPDFALDWSKDKCGGVQLQGVCYYGWRVELDEGLRVGYNFDHPFRVWDPLFVNKTISAILENGSLIYG